VADPPLGPLGDLAILRALAARLGEPHLLPGEEPEVVFEELRRATRGGTADYFGVTYRRLRRGERLYWPVRDEADPGTPALFETTFATPDGRARFIAIASESEIETPDPEYPWTFTTGRVREHYLSGTQTRRTPRLAAAAPEPLAELHPSLAAMFGIADGDLVRVTSRYGSVVLRARISADIRAETIFAAFHWGGNSTVNDVTRDVLDPISHMPAFKACAVRIARVMTSA
jgi:assimilatory nitrate reductase catalytic subunit